MSCGTYTLKSTLKDWFLRNFPWQFYLLSEICWEEIVFIFRFIRNVGLGVWTKVWTNRATRYLPDYGDFTHHILYISFRVSTVQIRLLMIDFIFFFFENFFKAIFYLFSELLLEKIRNYFSKFNCFKMFIYIFDYKTIIK